MGCSACAAKAAALNNKSISTKSLSLNTNTYTSSDCNYTKALLEKWYSALYCVRINNKSDAIGITNQKINSYLGYIQSALNYPENYCYYLNEIDSFQQNILPRIITNVPNCFN